MSVLWETTADGTLYSVRQSGASIRLYSNQVFHSQWNPNRPFAGGVWDCLSLPVYYRSAESLATILVLGVGGGAVIRQLDCLVPFHKLMGIELDPNHLEIAKKWFGVDDPRVTLLLGDAVQWLENYQGPPFDLIIDDLFGHQSGEPVRAVKLGSHWVNVLRRNLSHGGLLVINCVEAKELKKAQPEFIDSGFVSGYRWVQPAYDNAIGVVSNEPIKARDWSRRLETGNLSAQCQRVARGIIRRPLRGWL